MGVLVMEGKQSPSNPEGLKATEGSQALWGAKQKDELRVINGIDYAHRADSL